MARQTGPDFFTGRRGGLLGYQMAGKYYVRVISSLQGEQVRKDPAFKRTMQYAGLLARASKIASRIYRGLPEKEHGFYRRLTGMAMRLLKQGRRDEEAFEALYREFILAAHAEDRFSKSRPAAISQRRWVPVLSMKPVCILPKKSAVIHSGKPVSISQSRSAAILPNKSVCKDSFSYELFRRIFPTSIQQKETEQETALDLPPPNIKDELGNPLQTRIESYYISKYGGAVAQQSIMSLIGGDNIFKSIFNGTFFWSQFTSGWYKWATTPLDQ